MASDILHFRLQKRRHDEICAELSAAERLVQRLSPQAVLQFSSYLERHFADPSLHGQMQSSLIGLVQCLCALRRIEVVVPDTLLASTRRLFRDANGFTRKLCKQNVCREEAQHLATYLLSNSQFKRVRDRGVNTCFDALHAWISAVYFYAMVSDEIAAVAREIESREARLASIQARLAEYSRGRTSARSLPISSQPCEFSASAAPVQVSQSPLSRASLTRAISLGAMCMRVASNSVGPISPRPSPENVQQRQTPALVRDSSQDSLASTALTGCTSRRRGPGTLASPRDQVRIQAPPSRQVSPHALASGQPITFAQVRPRATGQPTLLESMMAAKASTAAKPMDKPMAKTQEAGGSSRELHASRCT